MGWVRSWGSQRASSLGTTRAHPAAQARGSAKPVSLLECLGMCRGHSERLPAPAGSV